MARDVVTLQSIADMKSIETALMTNHNAFPVINMAGKLIGMISRNFLIVLLQNKAFMNKAEESSGNL